ncbi:sulfotransferase [Marinicella sp. S1101]|uniref:sulfotransferase n=1 Tax=Marinicella marina TaxID=2996016 RepID=UPI002260B88A|nr:sulfotransferase [Marinicella marina]MCX7552955.1 sulfotransferase [Marinicella marina]MDJ1139735.1 sulfotransferase [Marinicella marina]
MTEYKNPIFITGRFRSGTSFLWQLFDQLDGFCAWYEPLHPQLTAAVKHVRPKTSHVGIEDYWSTYRQHPNYEKYHSSRFATEQLYLESGQRYRELKNYINHLIELSSPQVPVLQFNRMDFRLAWLKAEFPDATIIHIDRNSLHAYLSQRKHIAADHRHDADYWDAYELVQWCYALQGELPFLLKAPFDGHAFCRFYALDQLSRLMAKAHADININLDSDVFYSDDFVAKIAGVVALRSSQKDAMKKMVHIPQLPDFEDENFKDLVVMMTEVDLILSAAGLLSGFGLKTMKSIRFQNREFWRCLEPANEVPAKLQQMAQQIQQEVARITAENQEMSKQLNPDQPTSQPKNLSDNPDSSCSFSFDQLAQNEQQTINDLLLCINELNTNMTEILTFNHQLREQVAQITTKESDQEPQ